MRRTWRIAAVALFSLSMLLGGFFGDRLLALNGESRERLHLYTELLQAAHEAYGTDVTYRELVRASIEGMVRTLDPHTNFLSVDAYSTMRDRQQTSFYGLGILVGMRDRQLTVITPLEGTPASRMGIRAGDVITAIEGEPTDALNINEAVRRLKGPKGTSVKITVVRPGLDGPLDLEIVRDEIPQNTVRYVHMMTPEVGFMAITDFNRGTAQEVSKALDDLRAQGMERLLIDLRNNGGGLLDQAIHVVEQFVPQGSKIVETRGRTRDSFQEYYARNDGETTEIPLVILVGDGTASAAEILAGAVQDHDIGLIVGTPTWGKGLVQTVYTLSYGAGLALTTAKYYTPAGRLIQRDYSSWFDYANHSNGDETEEVADGEQVETVEAYLTDLGRKVYGGGGIGPDVEIEPAEAPKFLQFLLSRNVFFDFAVHHTSQHPVESEDWRPDQKTMEQFEQWLNDEEVATQEEIAEGLAEGENREFVRLYLRAEVFNSSFGMAARYRALAEGDPQVQKALSLFDDAADLLARRRQLDEAASQADRRSSAS